MHVIDEITSHKAVMKRLKAMHENLARKEKQERDPFQKTFLEKVREFLGFGPETRQHWIRAKLHWYGQSDWRRNELESVLEKHRNLGSMQTIINDSRGYDYSVDTLDVLRLESDKYKMTDEYMSLLRHADNKDAVNDMDFSVGSEKDEDTALLSTEIHESRAISCDDNKCNAGKPMKKTTTELFLSVQNFVLEKEKGAAQTGADAQSFAGTNLWAQSDDYLPGEKWEPDNNFAPLPESALKFDVSTESHEEDVVAIGQLLAQHNPSLFVAGT